VNCVALRARLFKLWSFPEDTHQKIRYLDSHTHMQTSVKAMRVRTGGKHHNTAASVVGGGPQAVRSRCRCFGRVQRQSRRQIYSETQAQQRRLSGMSPPTDVYLQAAVVISAYECMAAVLLQLSSHMCNSPHDAAAPQQCPLCKAEYVLVVTW
jgi:hypothetical protein